MMYLSPARLLIDISLAHRLAEHAKCYGQILVTMGAPTSVVHRAEYPYEAVETAHYEQVEEPFVDRDRLVVQVETVEDLVRSVERYTSHVAIAGFDRQVVAEIKSDLQAARELLDGPVSANSVSTPRPIGEQASLLDEWD